MFTLTSALIVTLFAIWIFVLCQETQEVKKTAGEDATLPCLGHTGVEITFIEWNRTELKSDLYVFLFRDKNSNANNQHESFRGRANVSDPNRKNGDASLILKNVNIDDTGTYECRIKEGNKESQVKLINTVTLTVTGGDKEGGDKEGGGEKKNVGPMVGLPVFAVLLVAVAVVGTMIFKKRRGNTAHPRGEADSLNPPTSG